MNLKPVIQSEVSLLEREKQISYINAYIWNLERWYRWTYLQGSNRDEDVENKFVDTVREGEGGVKGESSMETYALPSVKQPASGNLLYEAGGSNQVLCDNLDGLDAKGGGREIQEGEDGYMYVLCSA